MIKLHQSSQCQGASPYIEYKDRGLHPHHLPTHFTWRCGLVTKDSDLLGSSVGSTVLYMTLSNRMGSFLSQCSHLQNRVNNEDSMNKGLGMVPGT